MYFETGPAEGSFYCTAKLGISRNWSPTILGQSNTLVRQWSDRPYGSAGLVKVVKNLRIVLLLSH